MEKKRVPIRNRMLRMMLIPAIGAIAAATIISLVCMMRMANESEKALSTQLEGNLENLVESKAEVADAKFQHYSAYIDFICDYITDMYKNRDFLISTGRELDFSRATTPRGEFAMVIDLRTEDYNTTDPAIKADNLFFSNLEKVLAPIVKKNDGLISTSYLGTETGLLVSYDKYSYLSATPPGEKSTYDYFESEWYKMGRLTDDIFLTGLYIDSMGRGLTITIGKAFRDANGNFAGVCAADFDITGLYDEIIAMDIGEGAYSFTIDENGEVISPEDTGETAEAVTGLSTGQKETMLSEDSGIINTKDVIYAYATINTTGWKLCAHVPRTMITDGTRSTRDSINIAILIFVIAAVAIVLIILILARRTVKTITAPIEVLGADMKRISDGDLDHRATITGNDEISDTATRLNEMVERLIRTKNALSASRFQAEEMAALANKDALTGIRNKTAYDKEIAQLEKSLEEGDLEFGIAMVDLNDLKHINDTFGHDKGNISIIKLCTVVCSIFKHSPVFRVGGDEFVAILKNHDYEHREELKDQFKDALTALLDEEKLHPWERISASIGIGVYDKNTDKTVSDVFKKADDLMYEDKQIMKGKV